MSGFIGSIIKGIFGLIGSIMRMIFSVVNIPAWIYDLTITQPMTKYTYYRLLDRLTPSFPKTKKILDVGTGTGQALNTIIGKIPSDVKVVAIDIDEYYVKKATKLFANRENVEVRLQNFYDLETSNEKYDQIIFSSSFMLMPDQNKAISIAKKLLNPGGKIYFLMTLYNKKRELMEKVKPMIKHYTTIDFGKITYENEFDNLLKNNGLGVLLKERIIYGMNPILKVFRIFIVECEPAK